MIAADDRPFRPVVAGARPDVSRETEGLTEVRLPPPTEAAAAYLGSRLEAVIAYGRLLAGPGTERGLLGPREVPRLWERHLLNCAVVADLVPAGARVDDVGSGAGLPGIVLALVRPDLEVTLVEPLLRRTVFLEEAVVQLGAANVRVVRARAEDRARDVLGGRMPPADVVTARAVGPLSRLVGWCLPLLRPGGQLLAIKGSSAEAELAAAKESIDRAGGRGAELLTVGTGIVDPPAVIVRVTRVARVTSRPGRRQGAS